MCRAFLIGLSLLIHLSVANVAWGHRPSGKVPDFRRSLESRGHIAGKRIAAPRTKVVSGR
jgi:hypothetical protein